MQIRPGGDTQGAKTATQLMARAFRDNPLGIAVIGPSPARRLRCYRAGIANLLDSARRYGRLLFAESGGKLLGALAALPTGATPPPPPPLSAQLRTIFGQGFRVATRWSEIARHLQSLHPPQPHWYVSSLAVDPPAQGRGVGGALLTALLEHADREALPTYLETDRAINVRFYESQGFRVQEQIHLLDVAVWCMQRPSRPGLTGHDMHGKGERSPKAIETGRT